VTCGRPECRWSSQIKLPDIQKTIIYLDTSTISHIVRALDREEKDSPWISLFSALTQVVEDQVVLCPRSSLVSEELELGGSATAFVELARKLGEISLKHPLEVRFLQLVRALDRFVSGGDPLIETAPPFSDIFFESPFSWTPFMRVSTNFRALEDWVQSYRELKPKFHAMYERYYEHYSNENWDFEAIRQNEALGVAHSVTAEGVRAILVRTQQVKPINDKEALDSFMPTTFDRLIHYAIHKHGIKPEAAVPKVLEFLQSAHSAHIPYADVRSRVVASCALAFREGRKVQPGDAADIEHIATFVPYVDILIADCFFAERCRRAKTGIMGNYRATIRSLGEADIEDFRDCLSKLSDSSQQARLARKIYTAIHEGGYYQEFSRKAEIFMAAMINKNHDNPNGGGNSPKQD
jgi:hypothetical protein